MIIIITINCPGFQNTRLPALQKNISMKESLMSVLSKAKPRCKFLRYNVNLTWRSWKSVKRNFQLYPITICRHTGHTVKNCCEYGAVFYRSLTLLLILHRNLKIIPQQSCKLTKMHFSVYKGRRLEATYLMQQTKRLSWCIHYSS